MHLEPTMKQSVIRRSARRFAEERVAPLAAEMDGTATFPRALADEMASLDYFGLEIPREYGGAGLDTVSSVMVIEELSRVSGAMGLCISVHNSVAAFPVYEFGNADQRKVFLEPMARGKKHGIPYKDMELKVRKGEKERSVLKEIDEETKQAKGGLIGATMVSDAFFPFRDGVDVGIKEGIRAVVQPGGSMRDFEAIEACNEASPQVTMVFTGQRAFKH